MNRGDTDLHDALQKLEQVEDEIAKTVREADRDAEGTTETPVIKAETVDDLRDKLTQARADLVETLLARELDTWTPTIDHNVPQRTLLDEELPQEQHRLRRQRQQDE